MFAFQDRPDRRRFTNSLTTLTLALTLALDLGLGLGSGAASAAAPATSHAAKADQALARATAQIRAHDYTRARRSLAAVRLHTKAANANAKALIGAQPTDPESDDLPGPPAVLAALRLDNRITTRTVALFNGKTNESLVYSLRLTVGAAQIPRDAMLNAVIALPEEGDGVDYADGVADSLAQYTREVNVIATAVATYTLSPSGRTGLTNALARARATKAKVDRAFGGGERHAQGTPLR